MKYLTVKDIETGNFTDFFIKNAEYTSTAITFIRDTYTKYNEHNRTTYYNDFITQESLTYSDWEEGELVEVREYSNKFDDEFDMTTTTDIESTVKTLSIINEGTNQQVETDALPFLVTDPAGLNWDTETWGVDNVPMEFETVATKTGDNNYVVENRLESTIIIRLNDRFSLYHDYLKTDPKANDIVGSTLFKVNGVFVTPPDGKVYHTSDKDAFSTGKGKMDGHYLYYDSDGNAFYETVFILTPDEDGDGIYNVFSIGFNYDGKHDFEPYQVLNEDNPVGFNSVSQTYRAEYEYVESMGKNASYMFHGDSNEMKNFMKAHFPLSEFDNYIPKDQIFEISRLMPSSELNQYAPDLFLQVYSHWYGETWNIYRKSLDSDIWEQVLMITTAAITTALVGIGIAAITTLSASGIGAIAGVVFALIYFGLSVASQEEKRQIQAQVVASTTYYNLEKDGTYIEDTRNPTTLSDKRASEVYTLYEHHQGHPSAKYLPVSDSEGLYNGQAIVTPPKTLRTAGSTLDYSDDTLNMLINTLDTSKRNRLSKSGETILLDDEELTAETLRNNPRVLQYLFNGNKMYTALIHGSTSYSNLDYFLASSELPSYNAYEYYQFTPDKDTARTRTYSKYPLNSIGALENAVSTMSNDGFNTIRPYNINGRPAYGFIDEYSDAYRLTQPRTGLYKPIVVSQQRYNELEDEGINTGGIVSVDIKTGIYDGKWYSFLFRETPRGIDENLTHAEIEKGYKVKVPLLSKSFEYPITMITLDILELEEVEYTGQRMVYRNGVQKLETYTWTQIDIIDFASDIEISKQDYVIEGGTIYFTISFDDLVLDKYSAFALSAEEICSYRINIHIETVIPNKESSPEVFGTRISRDGINIGYDYVQQDYGDRGSLILDTTSNNLAKDALDQAISYLISDYVSIHTLAIELSQSQVEKEYTSHITRVSTLLTSLILIPLTILSAGASSAIHFAREAIKKGSKLALKQIIMHGIGRGLLAGLIQAVTIPIQVMAEEFEELYIDPAIEAFFLQWAVQTGTSREIAEFWAMFVSSFREAFMGPASNFISKIGGFDLDSKISKAMKGLGIKTQDLTVALNKIQEGNGDFAMAAELSSESLAEIDNLISLMERKSKRNFKSLIDAKRIASIAFSIPSFFVGAGGMATMVQALDLSTDVLFDMELQRLMPEFGKINLAVNELKQQRSEMHEVDIGLDTALKIDLRMKMVQAQATPTAPAVKSLESRLTQGVSVVDQLLLETNIQIEQEFKKVRNNQKEISGIPSLDIKTEVSPNDEFTFPVTGPNYGSIPVYAFDPVIRSGKEVKLMSFIDTKQRPLNVWLVNRKAQRLFNMDLKRPVVGIIKGRIIADGHTIVNDIGESMYIDIDTTYAEVQDFLSYTFDLSNDQWLYDPNQQIEFVYADEAMDAILKSYDIDYLEDLTQWDYKAKGGNKLAIYTTNLFNNHEGFQRLWNEVGYSMAGKGTLQGMVKSEEIASNVDKYYFTVLRPLKQSFKLLFEDLVFNRKALKTSLRSLFLRSWLSVEKVQEIKDNGRDLEEYRDAGLRLFDKQFPSEFFDDAKDWSKTIDQRISFVINDYIMREYLHLDQEGITPKIFHERLQEFLYDMDVGYGGNFLYLKEDILNEKTKTGFLLAFSELFFPPNSNNQLDIGTLGNLRTATGFFGWIKEAQYWYSIYPNRLSSKIASNGVDFITYSFMDWSPQAPLRPAAKDYNLGKKLLNGKQTELRLEWNNGIETSQIRGIPTKGREMDMLSLLWEALSFTTHVKTQREFKKQTIMERIRSVSSDYWSSLIADAEIFSVAGTTREVASGVFRDHEADIATTLNYVGDFADRKAISEKMAIKLLSVREMSEFKSPIDLNLFYKVTALINDRLTNVLNFDEGDIRDIFSNADFERVFWEEIPKVYGKKKFDEVFEGDNNLLLTFYNVIRNLFSNSQNFNKLYQNIPGANQHQLVWQGDIGNYLLAKDEQGKKIPLTANILPNNIMTLDAANSWTPLPSGYTFNEVHVIISGDNGEVGVLPLSTIIILRGKLPQGAYLEYEGYRNAIISDPNGNLLNGLVYLDTENRQFIIDKDWQASQVADNIIKPSDENDQNGIFTLDNAYRALILSTGDHVSIMFQKQVINFVPLGPFNPLFPKITILHSSIEILRKGMPHLEIANIAPYQDKNVYAKLDSLLDAVYQLSNAYELYGAIDAETTGLGKVSYSFNFAYLFNYESLLQLHKESRTLADGTVKLYTEDYFTEVLRSLDSDNQLDLSKISWFFIEDGKLDQFNTLKLKEFYKEFLDLIRDRINDGDIMFTEFKNKLDNLEDFDLTTNKFTDSEEKLLGDLRDALNTIFGYTGFTLMQMGLMVFNKIDGNFEFDFIIPSQKTLVKILNEFKIRPINTKFFTTDNNYDAKYLNDLRNRPRLFLSILFSGQMQIVEKPGNGRTKFLYSHPELDFISNIFPDFKSGIKDTYYHSEAYNLMFNAFYQPFGGRERFGQRLADAKIKMLNLLFSDIVSAQINLNTLKRYSPFSTMSEADQKVWLELNQIYYKIRMADAAFLPRAKFDPTSILFDIVTGVITSDKLKTTSAEKNINNKFAQGYKFDFGGFLSTLSTEDVRLISPALYFTYNHLFEQQTTSSNLNIYRAMTTDKFWKSVEKPIEHTVTQLKNILKDFNAESFVVQFRRPSHSGINNDKTGLLKARVYNAQDLGKETDYATHPEIKGTNILITGKDLSNARRFRNKIISIVYYMVKYQAFIVIKEQSARGKDVVLAATLTKIFTLDYVKSLTSDGNWGALTLTDDAESNYDTWQDGWNRGAVWNDDNAYIPFYLLPDYKSGANSFVDSAGNILGEGRLKELFLEKFGVNVEHLTTEYEIKA